MAIAVVAIFAGLVWRIRSIDKQLGPSDEERVRLALSECLKEQGLELGGEFAESPDTIPGRRERATLTIGKKLREIGAYPKDGIIYDRDGRKVTFRGIREWGKVPTREQEKMRWQELEEIERLESEGVRVIRMWGEVPPL